MEEAIAELGRRRKIQRLREVSSQLISGDVPEPFRDRARLALLRYINTPNHETVRFLDITRGYPDTPPLLCEYPQDKFVPSNISKRLLGKLAFVSSEPSGTKSIDRLPVIDFAKSQNSKIADIKTLWGQPLVAFHHQLFRHALPGIAQEYWYDISPWYHRHGPTARQYYTSLLALFVRDGILFENFIIQQKEEAEFFRAIFLPAFLEVQRVTGVKPLIVALEPLESEGDKYWLSYPAHEKTFVEGLIESAQHHGAY